MSNSCPTKQKLGCERWFMQQYLRLHLKMSHRPKKSITKSTNWLSSETYKNCMTTALMNPAPKKYSSTNPLAPSKLHERIHKFPPIKFNSRHLTLAFNDEFSHSICHKFIQLWCKIAAKWQWCCCVETNPDYRIQQTLTEYQHLHIQ